MKPGIYYDVPFQEYLEWPGISQSTLKHMAVPARAKWCMDHPKDASAEMLFGTALHTLLLEPARFMKLYQVHPKMDKRTKEWKQFEASLENKTPVDERIFDVAKGVQELAAFQNLISHKDTKIEVSIVWEENGILCKARLDIYNPTLGVIGDIKSTKSASDDGFAMEIFKNGYHMQVAMYQKAVQSIDAAVHSFMFFAVETKGPYLCSPYCLLPEVEELGFKQINQHIKTYAKCVKTGEWPGLDSQIRYIGIPTWSLKTLQEEYDG